MALYQRHRQDLTASPQQQKTWKMSSSMQREKDPHATAIASKFNRGTSAIGPRHPKSRLNRCLKRNTSPRSSLNLLGFSVLIPDGQITHYHQEISLIITLKRALERFNILYNIISSATEPFDTGRPM
jgi:hypothetical protein